MVTVRKRSTVMWSRLYGQPSPPSATMMLLVVLSTVSIAIDNFLAKTPTPCASSPMSLLGQTPPSCLSMRAAFATTARTLGACNELAACRECCPVWCVSLMSYVFMYVGHTHLLNRAAALPHTSGRICWPHHHMSQSDMPSNSARCRGCSPRAQCFCTLVAQPAQLVKRTPV